MLFSYVEGSGILCQFEIWVNKIRLQYGVQVCDIVLPRSYLLSSTAIDKKIWIRSFV